MAPSGVQTMWRFVLDARSAFPYDGPEVRQKTLDWSQTHAVSTALALLPTAERDKVLRYVFPRDAALSLAASLLKHFVIVRVCGVPWAQSKVTQERNIQNGKPFFEAGGIEFNVSHHGEAVVLIATSDKDIRVGIDLTHVDPDRDVNRVCQNGMNAWVDVFKDVFSSREVRNMVQSIPSTPRPDSETAIKGLRCFYSYWALKEAYFKMTGDALLSSVLQQLEFSNVDPPRPANGLESNRWAFGTATKASASLHNQPLDNVQLELIALGKHYIVATSVTSYDVLPTFEVIDVVENILPIATSA